MLHKTDSPVSLDDADIYRAGRWFVHGVSLLILSLLPVFSRRPINTIETARRAHEPQKEPRS